ncbi:MAG: hypothetical protein RL497_3 [Pseudomonadota bacterium]|jgi:hypothetical protein
MPCSRQSGFSLPTLLFLFLALGFGLTVFLKLFPLYQDDMLVKEAFKTFAEAHKDNLSSMTKNEMSSHLSKFFTVNGVRGEAANLNHLEVERLREKVIFRYSYETRIPFVKNVDLIVWFKNELDSSNAEACCNPSEPAKK